MRGPLEAMTMGDPFILSRSWEAEGIVTARWVFLGGFTCHCTDGSVGYKAKDRKSSKKVTGAVQPREEVSLREAMVAGRETGSTVAVRRTTL